MSLHESSIDDFGYIAPTPLPQHEWDLTGPIPAKSSIMDYGYVIDGKAVGCTAKELIEAVAQRSEVSFVWTPETPEPVRPEQVPFLTQAFRRIEVATARIHMGWGLALLALGGGLAFFNLSALSGKFLMVAGALALAEGNWRFWRARKYTQEDAISEASAARFAKWIKAKNVSGYTIIVVASIIVVTIFQGMVPNATALTGLVKPAVWSGEVWRLFTAALMHASFHHTLYVVLVLLWVSRIVEQTVQRALVPLVFLVSAVVGSVFSVVLSPHTASMGASGGIMGLLAFTVVAAYLDRTKFPPQHFKRMLTTTVLLGSLGFFGLPFIDSAAHLGGVVAGSVLGWLCCGGKWPQITGKPLRLAGLAGVLGMISTAVFAIYRLVS